MKKLFLLMFLSFFASFSSIFGQKAHFSLQGGYPLLMGFDSPNSGFYASLHATQRLNPSFAMEEKIAFANGKFMRNDNFFGHNGGSTTLTTAALGIRWNMRREATDFNPSLSIFPIGGGWFKDEQYNNDGALITPDKRFTYAPSAALNFQIKEHYNLGVELEVIGLIGSLYLGYSF
jgi:hypothetical protein